MNSADFSACHSESEPWHVDEGIWPSESTVYDKCYSPLYCWTPPDPNSQSGLYYTGPSALVQDDDDDWNPCHHNVRFMYCLDDLYVDDAAPTTWYGCPEAMDWSVAGLTPPGTFDAHVTQGYHDDPPISNAGRPLLGEASQEPALFRETTVPEHELCDDNVSRELHNTGYTASSTADKRYPCRFPGCNRVFDAAHALLYDLYIVPLSW
jgi:hypothetical protein